jgi:hypothetical protein
MLIELMSNVSFDLQILQLLIQILTQSSITLQKSLLSRSSGSYSPWGYNSAGKSPATTRTLLLSNFSWNLDVDKQLRLKDGSKTHPDGLESKSARYLIGQRIRDKIGWL